MTRVLSVRFTLLLSLSLLAIGMLGNFDFAAELEMEAEEKEMRPARVVKMNKDYQDCIKLRSREWLRFQVAHKSDKSDWQIHCEYGKPYLIAESL